MPKRFWPRMERCVKKVKASGSKVNAYAVCYKSIMRDDQKNDWTKKDK